MKKVMLRILLGIAIVLVGLVVYVQFAWDKTYDAPYPEITASDDPALIERGKHLAFGPAHCATCHIPMDKIMDMEKGEYMPLSGGWELSIPPGTFRAPNLTPDKETGIGDVSDAAIARAMRYSVGHKGNYLAPFMPFQEMSDYDVKAILSFLRSQPAVKNEVQPSEFTFLGKALVTFGLLKPIGPVNEPPKQIAVEPTAEYGKYIAHSVANCYACHSNMDLKTGEIKGPDFAGGTIFPPDDFSKGYAFVAPNLTPDAETGWMKNWDESIFMSRMKAGRVHAGSPMPWGTFNRMDSTELIAVWKYLQSLEPVAKKIDKVVYEPGESLPQ